MTVVQAEGWASSMPVRAAKEWIKDAVTTSVCLFVIGHAAKRFGGVPFPFPRTSPGLIMIGVASLASTVSVLLINSKPQESEDNTSKGTKTWKGFCLRFMTSAAAGSLTLLATNMFFNKMQSTRLQKWIAYPIPYPALSSLVTSKLLASLIVPAVYNRGEDKEAIKEAN